MDSEETNEALERVMAEHIRRQREIHKIAKRLKEKKMERPKHPTFTYLEYLEMNAEEMQKFKHLKPISQEEIDNVNWEQLTEQLVTE